MKREINNQEVNPNGPEKGWVSYAAHREMVKYMAGFVLGGMISAGVLGYGVGTNEASLHRLMFGRPALPSIENVIDNADSIKIVDWRSSSNPNSVEVIVGYTDNRGRLSEVVKFAVRDNPNRGGGIDLEVTRKSLDNPFYTFDNGLYHLLSKEKVPQDIMGLLEKAEKKGK